METRRIMAKRGMVEGSILTASEPRQASYKIVWEHKLAWTRHGEAIPAGEQLYVIWKTKGPCNVDEYEGGLGYAGHLPTDKESAQWYAERTTERIRMLYWWQADALFEVIPYKPQESQNQPL